MWIGRFCFDNFQHTGKWATVWSSKVKTDFTKLQTHLVEVSMSHHFEIGLSICFLQFISLIFLCTLQQEPSSKFIFCIKKKGNRSISFEYTFSSSELSQPRHSYQYGHLVFDVQVVFFLKSIIPHLIINVW